MSSNKIEQTIDELEEYIDNCKPQFMSSTNIIVNKEELEELIRELRQRTPEEIKRYQKMLSNKDAIINDAKARAESMINEANAQTTELVSEHEIMQRAYEQANEVVSEASDQARAILDNATIEANNLRAAAVQYMDDMLAGADEVFSSAISTASAQYDSLIDSMNRYVEVIRSNREELKPDDSGQGQSDEYSEVSDEGPDVI